MGVDSGPLVVSRLADGHHVEYTAIGETMTTAGLLQQFAGPGSILMSETTRRSVDKYVAVDPVQVALLPGGRAYRVAGLLPRAEPKVRLARTRAPLIGRDHEIAILRKLLDEAIAGRGQVLGLVGEPGMGKSRLVDEFTQEANPEPGSLTIVEGGCVSYGGLIPYLPIADLVRAYCGVDATDQLDATGIAIERAIHELGLPPDAGSALLRVIGLADREAPPESVSPEAVKARTFDVLRLLFLKAAARRPIVLVVEDVHWIDRTSEEFLATLVERLAGARVLLVATPDCRPLADGTEVN
jgi:hypothetical protein